jgi:hypothetical protein
MRLSQRSVCTTAIGDTLRYTLVLICFLASAAAAARPHAAGALGAAPELVVLESRLGGAMELRLEETLAELLRRIQLRLAVADARNADSVLAFVSIEPSEGGAIVTVRAARPPNSRLRHEVAHAASIALFCETLAHVIFGDVEPMLQTLDEAQAPPDTPALPQPAEQTPALAKPAPEQPQWSLGASGGARWFVAEATTAAWVGVGGAVTFDAPLRPALALEAGYLIPLIIARNGVRAQFSLVSARARPGLQLLQAEVLALSLELAAGLDFVTLAPLQAEQVSWLRTSARVQPMLGGAAAAHLELSKTLDLVARLGVDLDLAPRRWLIENGPEQNLYFETPRAMPYLTLGFDWSPSAGWDAAAERNR